MHGVGRMQCLVHHGSIGCQSESASLIVWRYIYGCVAYKNVTKTVYPYLAFILAVCASIFWLPPIKKMLAQSCILCYNAPHNQHRCRRCIRKWGMPPLFFIMVYLIKSFILLTMNFQFSFLYDWEADSV